MQMDLMRLYDISKNFIRVIADPIDTKIEYDIKLDDKVLTFRVVDSEPIIDEQYIRFYGQEWVVKATRRDGQYIEVTAKHNIEELVGNAFNFVKTTSLTLNETLTVIFNGANTNFPSFGWTYALSTNLLAETAILARRRSIDVETIKFIDVLQEVIRLWFLEVEFNTLNKQVIFHYKRGSNKGVYFSSQLNLRKIDLESDTYDYATRLIPVGKDGLRISAVNGGKNYVENYTYSNKVLTAFWVDTRYTSATALRDDAILRLEELAMPMRVYSCDIIDLSSQNPMLSYEIGDTVTIMNEQLGIKDVQRIMKMVVYPYETEKNTADLASRKPKFEDLQNEMLDSRDKVNATILANGQISGYSVVGVNKNFLDIEQDVDGISTNIGQINDELNEVVTFSRGILLSNESQSFVVDEDGLTALALTPIYTKVGTYQAGGRIASSFGTIEFYNANNVPITLPVGATIDTVYPTTSSDGEISIILPQGTDLVTRTGYIMIPIIIGTTTYLKRLYWSAVEIGEIASGLDGITMILTNDSTVIATDVNGDNGDYSQAYTDIQIFVGIINDTANWSFSANTTDVTGDFDSIFPNRYKVDDLEATNGSVELIATKGPVSISKVFSLSKAFSGEEGVAGATYFIQSEVSVVPVDEFGNYKTTDILITGKVSQGGVVEDYLGRFLVEEFSRITQDWSTVYSSSVDEYNYSHIINPNVSAVRFSLYESGGLVNRLDIQTVPMVYDGMSNRYVAIQATSQIFESTDGGVNFSPSNIYLTPVILNANFDKWQFSYDGETYIDLPLEYPAWTTATEYEVGNVVSYLGVNHQCLVAHTSTTVEEDTLVEPNPWLPSIPYIIGDIVEHDGIYYLAIEDHTSGPSFSGDISFWEQTQPKWSTVASVNIINRGGYSNVLQVPSNSALFLYGGELAFNIVFRVFVNYTLDGDSLSAFDTITVARTFNSTELVNVITQSYARRLDSLEKFETEVGERIYYGEAYQTTNLITNGDFSNGSTGWTLTGASVVSEELVLNTTIDSNAYQAGFTWVNADKIYLSYRARESVDNSGLSIFLATSANAQISDAHNNDAITLTNATYSHVFTLTQSATNGRVYITRSATARDGNVILDNLLAINLTQTFGVGNEPTKEEMDSIVAKFSNGWFSGANSLLRDEPLVTNFTNWKQEIDNFLLSVQSGGGYNLIKNSVGYRDPNNSEFGWSLSGGGTVTQVSANQSSFINASTSKNGFGFTGSKVIAQAIPIIPTRKLSFSIKVNTQSITSGTVRVYVVINGTTLYLLNRVHDSSNPINSTFQMNLNSGTATSCTVYIETVSVVGVAYFTDFLLAYGENISEWQQANGEIHNLNVLIDTNGITVLGTEPNSYTNITPFEFAGYYQGARIFTLNGTVTEVQELRIKKAVGATETALWIKPFRIVQTPTSLDFVWIGDTAD
jgi:phage minor structural protein